MEIKVLVFLGEESKVLCFHLLQEKDYAYGFYMWIPAEILTKSLVKRLAKFQEHADKLRLYLAYFEKGSPVVKATLKMFLAEGAVGRSFNCLHSSECSLTEVNGGRAMIYLKDKKQWNITGTEKLFDNFKEAREALWK